MSIPKSALISYLVENEKEILTSQGIRTRILENFEKGDLKRILKEAWCSSMETSTTA